MRLTRLWLLINRLAIVSTCEFPCQICKSSPALPHPEGCRLAANQGRGGPGPAKTYMYVAFGPFSTFSCALREAGRQGRSLREKGHSAFSASQAFGATPKSLAADGEVNGHSASKVACSLLIAQENTVKEPNSRSYRSSTAQGLPTPMINPWSTPFNTRSMVMYSKSTNGVENRQLGNTSGSYYQQSVP